MEEYNRLVDRQQKWMLYLLVFFLLAIVITPYKKIFMSILLGYVAGYYSLRFLSARVKRFAESVVVEGKARSLGTFIRFAGMALLVVLATKFPEKIHIPSLAGGLGLAYIVLFVDYSILHLLTERTSTKSSESKND